jgi:uncharacterized protein (TIGR00730 family)
LASICVFCSSSEGIDPRLVKLSERVGAALAARGHRLVSGGGNISMMGGVARAAREAGAHTTGVIPEGLLVREVGDRDADEFLVVSDMRIRKAEMDRRSDAFLVLPGGIGTLEELFEVWVARTLGLSDKPVVILDPYGDFGPLQDLLEHLFDRRFVGRHALRELRWATDVDAALDAVEELIGVPAERQPDPGQVLEADVDRPDLLPWPTVADPES